MRVACLFLIGLLCLGPTGCALFKKNKDGDRPANGEGGRPPAQFPGSNDPLFNSTKVNPAPKPPFVPATDPGIATAMLAGRVIDGLNRAPTNTLIRCVNLDDKSAAPVEIPVSTEGYFTIQGLKSGAHYKLVARGKSGEKMLASITYHTAPNIRVLIQVREDLSTGGTQEDLSEPKAKEKEKEQAPADPPQNSFQQPKDPPGTWVPGVANPATFNSQEPVLPVQVQVPFSGNPGPANSGIVEQPKQWPPTLQIRPATPTPLRIEMPKPAQPTPYGPAPIDPPFEGAGPARVPSCVLVGKQLVNFALSDINGEPWELRSQRKGKLLLVDFWGTWCVPCKESMPHLAALHNKYYGKGLEVVGIAYENGGSPEEQAYKILDVCKKNKAHYRQLLGAGSTCPVRSQFNVAGLPTVVLIDENGWVIWRHEGRLDATSAGELDRLVQRRLGNRPF